MVSGGKVVFGEFFASDLQDFVLASRRAPCPRYRLPPAPTQWVNLPFNVVPSHRQRMLPVIALKGLWMFSNGMDDRALL